MSRVSESHGEGTDLIQSLEPIDIPSPPYRAVSGTSAPVPAISNKRSNHEAVENPSCAFAKSAWTASGIDPGQGMVTNTVRWILLKSLSDIHGRGTKP